MGQTLNDADLVFNNSGKPLRPNTVTYAWERIAARTGIKVIRLHDARHTHASLMLKQGIHPKIVQERLGHTSIQMTLDTYSHVAPGIQQAAAESFDKLLKRDSQSKISSKLIITYPYLDDLALKDGVKGMLVAQVVQYIELSEQNLRLSDLARFPQDGSIRWNVQAGLSRL